LNQFRRSLPQLTPRLAFQNQPADPDYNGDRLQLFNLDKPLTLSVQDFEARWSEVDNVWVQFGTTKTLKKDPQLEIQRLRKGTALPQSRTPLPTTSAINSWG
jgi:hypothetical protein